MRDSKRIDELSDIYFEELIHTITKKSAELAEKGLRPAYVKLPVRLKDPLYLMLNQDILRASPTIKLAGLEVIFSYAIQYLDDIVVIEDPYDETLIKLLIKPIVRRIKK